MSQNGVIVSMKLIDYLRQLPAEQREPFAALCATSIGHLRNVAYGYRPCSPELAVQIEQATERQVTRQELCPENWSRIWPELAESEPNQPAALAGKSLVDTENVAEVV